MPHALVRLLLVLLAGLSLSGPLAAQVDPKHARTIESLSPFTKAETADRVSAGLVESGYALDRVDGTTIIPAVRMVRNVSEVHLRVNLLTSGDSTRVVTSATYDIPTLGLKNEPAEANRSGMKKLVWQEVEAAAAAVTRAVAPDAAAPGK